MVQRRSNGLVAAAFVAILIVPTILLSENSYADETAVVSEYAVAADDLGFAGYWTEEEVALAMTAVTANDKLKTTREVERWRSIDDPELDDQKNTALPQWWSDLLAGVGWFVSIFIEFALWIAIAVLAYVIFATRDRWWPLVRSSGRRRTAAPRVMLAGGEIKAEHMPANVPAEVMRLWKGGHKREALSLLYRASVFALVTEHGVKLPKSATEGDCILAVVQQSDEAQLQYFRRVVTVWTQCAYDFDDPVDTTVAPLCDEWPQYYGRTA